MYIDTIWSLFPPFLAIALAIGTRKVYLALCTGVVSGAVLLESSFFQGLLRTFQLLWETLNQPANALLIVFILVVGALISSLQGLGGLQALVRRMEKRGLLSTRRSVRLFAWWTGVCLFIESNMTIMVAGALARPLFDKWKISREKLAYLIDSTSGPICLLIPFNAWGIYVVGLLQTAGAKEPVRLLGQSILYNFYSVLAISLAFIAAYTGWSPGPMKAAEERTRSGQLLFEGSEPMAGESLFVAPESGARPSLFELVAKGARSMLGLATIILLALTLGDLTRLLGTGQYVAALVSDNLTAMFFLPTIFILSALISFSTGTSWGTFAIMIPVVMPSAASLGMAEAPLLAAALSGGIFGDHASPISNTTIISSMAALTDHTDHVKTQLPYCLIAGGLAVVGYLLVGAIAA